MSLFIKSCIVSTCQPSDGVMDYIDRYNLQDTIVEPVFPGSDNCLVSECVPNDSVSSYVGGYNVQSTIPISNSAVFLPIGGGLYVSVPPGTFTITPPINGGSFTIDTGLIPCPNTQNPIPGCNRSYSYEVPAGASQAQIQSLLDAATAEAATIKAQCCTGQPDTVINPQPQPKSFQNQPQSITCGGSFGGLEVTGILPSYITATFTTLNIATGVFTSTTSQADANNQAQFALVTALDGGAVTCGWWNTAQTCPDSSVIAANTYFSTVSQAAANALALAACPSPCAGFVSSLVWAVTPTILRMATAVGSASGNTGTFSCTAVTDSGANEGAGTLVFTTSIHNSSGSTCKYNLTLTGLSFDVESDTCNRSESNGFANGNFIVSNPPPVLLYSKTFTVSGINTCVPVIVNNTTPVQFTVPAGQTVAITLTFIAASSDATFVSTANCSGTFTITPA